MNLRVADHVVVMSMALLAPVLVTACGQADEAEPVADTLVATRIDVGGAPWGIVVDGDVVWVSDASRATVLELDVMTGRLLREVGTGASDPRDAGLAVDDGRLWVANLGGSVGVLDVASGTLLERVGITPGEPAAVALSGGAAWSPRHGPRGGLSVITGEGRHAEAIELPTSAFALAVTADTVWVSGLDRDVFAVDTASRTVRHEVELPGAPRGVASAEGDIWVTLRDRQEVARIDGETGDVIHRIAVDGQPWPISSGAGAVWVALLEGRLVRIDPDTNQVTASIAIGAQPRAVAVGEGTVWVTSQAGTVSRIDLDP